MEKAPEELYKEREKRVNDAIQLKVPDRVPFFPITELYAAKHTGMTLEEAFYDADKWFAAMKKTVIDLEPDIFWPFGIFSSGQAYEALDFKQIKWPGHGVSPVHTFQFVEGEYMKADEYDAFLNDLSDFTIRTYLPRICGTLEPIKMLPPLNSMLFGYIGMGIIASLTIPGVADAFKTLYKAGLEAAKWNAAYDAFVKETEELGFPASAAGAAMAPFDVISDLLRGMRGTMLDIYRQPDKLLEALERILQTQSEFAVSGAKATGNPRVFMPLHRGADGFLSLEHFKTFYWPTLKRLILTLIDEGLTPCPFWEGCYDSRLECLAELPKGKVLGSFDIIDLKRAKEILGNTMCISGNMPVSLLQVGTPQQIKDYTKMLIDVVGKDGGFIMSSRAVMGGCEPERVKVWADATREYGVYQ